MFVSMRQIRQTNANSENANADNGGIKITFVRNRTQWSNINLDFSADTKDIRSEMHNGLTSN